MALKTCKECKKEVSSSAKTCPHCGVSNPAESEPTTKEKVGGCLFLVLLVIGGAIWFGSGSKNDSDAVKSDTPKNTEPQKEVVHYTAPQLFNSYDQNEVATDEANKNKLINVTGRVQEITKDFTNSIVIEMRTSNEFMPANFGIEDAQKSIAANLSKGDAISITCEKMSRVMGAPSGSDCTIDTPKPTQANSDSLNCSPQDKECAMQKMMISSMHHCEKRIENHFKSGFAWGDGRRFSVDKDKSDEKKGVVVLSGDNIRTPLADGSTAQWRYECSINYHTGKLLFVGAAPIK